MKSLAIISSLLWALSQSLGLASAGETNTSQLQCDIGPVKKLFGGTPWVVYLCNDRKSLAIFSAPDNPASPFYFFFHAQKDGYRLVGEGTGRKEATAAAFSELKAMSAKDIAELVDAFKSK